MPLEEDTPDLDLPSAPRSAAATSVEVSARQVFDVQWSFSGKELNALEFKRPAGTGLTGGFFRPIVDQDNDYYRLLFSEHNAAQFQLRQYGANGELKHQLTTYGQIKAISKEAILYNGDAQYGTLITLRKRYNYGNSAKFTGLTVAPSKDFILEVFEACRADRLRGATGDPPVPDVGVPEVVRLPSEMRRASSIASEEPCRPSIRVKFNPKVSTVCLRNLRDLVPARKADFWWTQDDFAEFLKVRVQIGKVYRQAAKQLGVDILKVSSEGSHREEGYEQMVKEFPELAQESRRGLGLGRKKERGRNRDAYIASVLKEQFRQRQQWENNSEAASVCMSSTEDYSEASEEDIETECLEEPECLKAETQSQIGEEAETTPELDEEASCGVELYAERLRGSDSHCGASEAETTAPSTPCVSLRAGLCVPVTPFELDVEALARAAKRTSKQDRDYAHFLAQIYYEQDRIEMGYPANRTLQLNIQEMENMNSPFSAGSDETEDVPTSPISPTGGFRRRRCSEDLKGISQEDDSELKDENEEELGNDIRRTANWCKGFGLPRDKLYEAGLSATGHAVTRSRRLCKLGDSPSSDGESDLESGNSDWEA